MDLKWAAHLRGLASSARALLSAGLVAALVSITSCSPSAESEYARFLEGPVVGHVAAVLTRIAAAPDEACGDPAVIGASVTGCRQARAAVMSHRGSRLLVLQASPALGGGEQLAVVFEDPADDLYYVWVYPDADGTHELRAFRPLGAGSADAQAAIDTFKQEFSFESYWLEWDAS